MLDLLKNTINKLFFNRLINLLKKLPLSPNHWTFLGFLFGITTAISIYQKEFYIAIIFLILTALCDMIDGALARNEKITTKFGKLFDTTIDKYIEGLVALAIALIIPSVYLPSLLWGAIGLFGSIIISVISNVGQGLTDKKTFKLMSRSDRGIFLIISLILTIIFNISILAYALIIITILSHLTAIILLIEYYIILKKEK